MAIKLCRETHVMPQRDRIGFDDAYISEEGRPYYGSIDDYDQFLAEKGFVGEQLLIVINNDYTWRTCNCRKLSCY